jgi:riboflavin kinase/FMN adenylyltransferase
MQSMAFVYKLLNDLKPSKIIVGKDFKFGRGRLGDVKQLKQIFNVKEVTINNKYKTSNIKHILNEGNIPLVNKLLITPYIIDGIVIHGKNNGKKLGYPTANISFPTAKTRPKNGSYVAYTYIGGKRYASAVFIKNNLVESHIFNFNKNIYGKTIEIELIKYHKPSDKVQTFEGLKKVINKKVNEIKYAF